MLLRKGSGQAISFTSAGALDWNVERVHLDQGLYVIPFRNVILAAVTWRSAHNARWRAALGREWGVSRALQQATKAAGIAVEY
jgi:hypothetical protein